MIGASAKTRSRHRRSCSTGLSLKNTHIHGLSCSLLNFCAGGQNPIVLWTSKGNCMRRKLRRIAWIAGGCILVVVASLGGLYLAFTAIFMPEPGAPHYPKPASGLEAQRQDLDYFRKVMALDRSFPASARAEAERRIATLERASQALPQQKLHVELMRIMALADNGHTRVRAGITDKTVLTLPVGVARFAEGFFVMRAKTPWREMVGGRVESIDGMPFPKVLQSLEILRGGTEPFRQENAALYISVQDLLYGSGIARKPDRSDWTV